MYREAIVDVGHLEKQRIKAVFMPRRDFLDIVQATLDDDDYSPIADKVLKTAQTMERFPFGAWIHETRGCGCLVGEMLIADEVIDEYGRRTREGIPVYDSEVAEDIRRKLAQSPFISSTNFKTVDRLLRERHSSEYVDVLIAFGDTIDDALNDHLLCETTPDWNADAIIIEDS